MPWKDLDIDIVVESTGFLILTTSKAHLDAGAKRVVITAPVKDDMALTFTPNVNAGDISKSKITSNASMHHQCHHSAYLHTGKKSGHQKAVLNTIHAYTATQGIVDKPDAKDWRRGRAGTIDISPSSTGAYISSRQSHTGNERNF